VKSHNWKEVRLSEVVDVSDYVANGSFASLRENVRTSKEDGYAVLIRAMDYTADWKGPYVYVDEQSYRFLRKSSLQPGDVIVSNVGSVGTVFRAPDLGMPMTLGPNAVVCRPISRRGFDIGFLYYLLSSDYGQRAINAITSGSAQPKFNKTDLRNTWIPFPPVEEQRAIAHILGTLDDKIELNRQMNQTLDELARTIFRSWFVDFDPVRAKAEGREPEGMDAETAALFPDRFVDSALGPIPEGWEVRRLGDVSDLRWGDTKVTKKSYVQTEGWPAYSASGPDGVLPYADYDRDGIVLSAIGAQCGLTWLARGRWSCIKNTIRVLEMEGGPSIYLLYYSTANPDIWPKRGSAQPFISQADARNVLVVVPSLGIDACYVRAVMPILDLIEHNQQESKNLAEIRDTLLPELLSGRAIDLWDRGD